MKLIIVQIHYILERLRQYGDVEPLCKMIEEGNEEVLQNDQIRHLLVEMLRKGGTHRGRGNPAESRWNQKIRDDYILRRLQFLKNGGMPIWNNEKCNQRKTACYQVSDELFKYHDKFQLKRITPSSIYKNVWLKKGEYFIFPLPNDEIELFFSIAVKRRNALSFLDDLINGDKNPWECEENDAYCKWRSNNRHLFEYD